MSTSRLALCGQSGTKGSMSGRISPLSTPSASARIASSISSRVDSNSLEDSQINPGNVFDLTLPLEQVAEGYRAMDERRAIKALLRP